MSDTTSATAYRHPSGAMPDTTSVTTYRHAELCTVCGRVLWGPGHVSHGDAR